MHRKPYKAKTSYPTQPIRIYHVLFTLVSAIIITPPTPQRVMGTIPTPVLLCKALCYAGYLCLCIFVVGIFPIRHRPFFLYEVKQHFIICRLPLTCIVRVLIHKGICHFTMFSTADVLMFYYISTPRSLLSCRQQLISVPLDSASELNISMTPRRSQHERCTVTLSNVVWYSRFVWAKITVVCVRWRHLAGSAITNSSFTVDAGCANAAYASGSTHTSRHVDVRTRLILLSLLLSFSLCILYTRSLLQPPLGAPNVSTLAAGRHTSDVCLNHTHPSTSLMPYIVRKCIRATSWSPQEFESPSIKQYYNDYVQFIYVFFTPRIETRNKNYGKVHYE